MIQLTRSNVATCLARTECFKVESGAVAIMGEASVHGIGQVESAFGVDYSPEQLRRLAVHPFPDATLRECRSSHLLIAGYPLTLRDLWERYPNLFFNKRDAWFANEAFAAEAVDPRWYLLRKASVPGSLGKGYCLQLALLSAGEQVPRMCEVTYALILHFLMTGERLLSRTYMRCRDIHPRGGRVDLGDFSPDGVIVGGSWDGHSNDSLGLAGSRLRPVSLSHTPDAYRTPRAAAAAQTTAGTDQPTAKNSTSPPALP